MRKLAILLVLLLQSFVYSGPVCGNHATTAESMACCEDGHHSSDAAGLNNAQAVSCCGSCDTAKGSIVRQREDKNIVPQLAVQTFLQPAVNGTSVAFPVFFDFVWKRQKFHSVSPPELFLLNQSLLI